MEEELDVMRLNSYLRLPQRIQKAQDELASLRDDFYANHSFMGSSFILNDNTLERQLAYSPEWASIDLISSEEALKKLIQHLSERWRDMLTHFSQEELETVSREPMRHVSKLMRINDYIKQYEQEKEKEIKAKHLEDEIKQARREWAKW